jgi:DNA-binding HxlR family transcriptional regulator
VPRKRRAPRRFPDVPRGPLAPALEPEEVVGCPVEQSLGLFGRKWAMLIIRDLTFYPGITFGQILRRNAGMTARALSLRLRDLREARLVEKVADPEDDRVFHYRLTEKGMDAVPVMVALASFGLTHLPDRVFADGRPRSLSEVFPGKAEPLLGRLARFAARDRDIRPKAVASRTASSS